MYVFEQPTGIRFYAVNVAAEESDLSSWSSGAPWRELEVRAGEDGRRLGATRGAMAAADAEQKNGLWGWFLLAAGCLLLIELTAANRTTR